LIENDVENIGPKDIETYGLSKRFDNEIGMILKAFYFALLEKENPKEKGRIQDLWNNKLHIKDFKFYEENQRYSKYLFTNYSAENRTSVC
jgi:hypothetical protein